ncbi:cobalamin biosynthesis protein CobD/CbiB [Peribacillus simplex]|uniref:cobalamin biosynthesis protein n=1 Tax=Peribacillus simplex TaxID=1478 RepID=UPI002815F4B9|nr:cobalamin biosynthesis protein [Peribacillus simplex]MDF9758703.1 cobalamin biosynthesis protein CobD/CbiB [Peribacillus simplex]
MIYHHLIAVTLAFFLDLLIGDPPNWPHPVKWIGTMISKLDQAFNRGAYKKRNGLFMLIIVLAMVILITGLTVYLAYRIHPLAGIFLERCCHCHYDSSEGLKASWNGCVPSAE